VNRDLNDNEKNLEAYRNIGKNVEEYKPYDNFNIINTFSDNGVVVNNENENDIIMKIIIYLIERWNNNKLLIFNKYEEQDKGIHYNYGNKIIKFDFDIDGQLMPFITSTVKEKEYNINNLYNNDNFQNFYFENINYYYYSDEIKTEYKKIIDLFIKIRHNIIRFKINVYYLYLLQEYKLDNQIEETEKKLTQIKENIRYNLKELKKIENIFNINIK
jgi:hypothetical protein